MQVIFWNDTRPRYATPNMDCGLTLEEIAKLVVPEGISWEPMEKSKAEAIVAPYNKAEACELIEITFAQLLIGLVAEGWITGDEGKLWLSGKPPAVVEQLISQLPEGQQFPAYARAVSPSVVKRSDPLVVALGEFSGKTAQDMDAFFDKYSKV